jgi:hypothetical protein
MKKAAKTQLVIHGFALAHALTSLWLYPSRMGDTIPLTILTIAMIVVIARMHDYPLDVMAVLALLSCFAGFYIGTAAPELLRKYAILTDGVHQITTFIVTELLGWAAFFIVKAKKKRT